MIAIGLLLASILGVWAAFSSLVYRYKRPLTFTVAGVAVYVGTLITGVLLSYLLHQAGVEFRYKRILLDIAPLVMAVGVTGLFFFLLKRAWEKNPRDRENSALLDDIN